MQLYKAEILNARNVLSLSRLSKMQDEFWLLISLAARACIIGNQGRSLEDFSNEWNPGAFFLDEGDVELSAWSWKKWSRQITFRDSMISVLSNSLDCVVLTCMLPSQISQKDYMEVLLILRRIFLLLLPSPYTWYKQYRCW